MSQEANAGTSGAIRGGPPTEDTPLVGVVIGFPENVASELQVWRASFGDPMAPHVPAHITLVTTTPARDWGSALDHVRSVARHSEPFTVTLKGTGSFQPVSPVVFLNVDRGFDSCVRLHEALQDGPLARDLDFPFHPHVTVAHDVGTSSLQDAEQALSSYEATIPVDRIGVYEHVANGFWKLREEVPLGGAPAGR
ncbi:MULTISPECIES: 2'-5' RNA ligase family protein [Arthrobacter]|uniref:2'-5' RNA ligase family protein n=2 Tax=Arthrobacter TaxID=1663 RepID=A0ABU9KKN3_9MICC|nr:2'-5' RNA ligase family protein [Arthrobacter sp. YJM1]MDP5227451.1 2'-5' RNA ligase family protein [Arthrobacter sp. YJM1]